MSYYGYPPYVSVAEKKEKSLKALAKLKAKNKDLQPITIEGRTLVKSWWGKAWNENLESYADYSNRISRGRSYVRNNAVLDLKIAKGEVKAIVQGSSSKPYTISILIDKLSKERWNKVIDLCNHRVDTLEELLAGSFPKDLVALFKEKKYGLFPSPKEIHFDCSCPDWASMCKHIAAVLYGIGARLDTNPLLFFELRDIDSMELVKKSMEKKLDNMLKNANKKSERKIVEKDVFDLFGI
ncbi:MAG: hypothetical protein K0R34_3190 [Herbinix sp.]|jgi:uncharacterized Zn finger protein|nr:hypothetical protein [Herbinix sp.]